MQNLEAQVHADLALFLPGGFRSDLEYRELAPAQGTSSSVRREMRQTSRGSRSSHLRSYWRQVKNENIRGQTAEQEHIKTDSADSISPPRERRRDNPRKRG